MNLQTTQNNEVSIFNADSMAMLVKFADLMASASVAVPDHLKGKPADCMAIAMQSAQWGMNPYAVAQKTHIVNGKLGYEAQLVSAVIGSSKAIQGRFKYKFVGEWSNFKVGNAASEKGLGVQCGAILAGEDEITWGHVIYLEHITIRNSPLWKTNPQQQISYLATKYWARIYTPDVILGVYTHEELEDAPTVQEEKEINPKSVRGLNAAFANSKKAQKAKVEPETTASNEVEKEEVNPEPKQEVIENNEFEEMTKAEEIHDLIKTAKTKDDYRDVSKMYSECLKADLITTAEAEKLRPELQALFDSLNEKK